jgi:hypothetical protein
MVNLLFKCCYQTHKTLGIEHALSSWTHVCNTSPWATVCVCCKHLSTKLKNIGAIISTLYMVIHLYIYRRHASPLSSSVLTKAWKISQALAEQACRSHFQGLFVDAWHKHIHFMWRASLSTHEGSECPSLQTLWVWTWKAMREGKPLP